MVDMARGAPIKGITVVIDGDTVGLTKALGEINSKSKNLQRELFQVDKLLKLDPKNVDLLAQKQEIVAKQTELTTKKLKALKDAQSEVQALADKGDIGAEEMRKYQREILQTEQKLKGLQGELKETEKVADKTATNMSDKLSSVGKGMITGLGTATAVVGGTLAATAKKSMDFESQISRVGAISGASSKELDGLRESALKLGASTSKSATEVAQGQEALAALGFTAEQIIGAMPGVISAAEASGSDMAQTAEVMASTLNIFGLEVGEANKVADILAKTANISAASLTDMQYALKYAGPPAAALGISLEETSAAIGIMTNAGMKGEQAGTTLRGALLGLLDPSEENSKTMEKMGIAITDNAGNFVGLSNLIKNLQTSMKGQTDTQKAATLSALVGKEAVSGMLSLMDAGPATIDKMTTSLENSGGASAEAAGKMKDNLKGTLDELSGSFETMQISIGTALTPTLEKLAEEVQKLADWFNKLSPENKKLIADVGLLITGLTALGVVVGILSVAVGFLISPIGLIVLAITAVIAIGVLLWKNWDKISAKAKEFGNYLKEKFEEIKSAISEKMTKVMDKIKEIWGKVENFFKNIDLKQIGKDAIQGLINGVGSMGGKILEKAKEIAGNIGKGIKQALKIGSPSKLTMELGEFTGQGLAEGLQNSMNQIKDMSIKMANTAVPPVKSPVNNIVNQTAPNKALTVNIHSPKSLDVREANREFSKSLAKMSLQW
jgi:TP901 family phage tail tape measure protein